MKKILIIDNFDSFTYNLAHLVEDITNTSVSVIRNNIISPTTARLYDGIILSPGPGIPSEAGFMPDIVKELAPTSKILGVCLGHQCIGEIFGAKLINLKTVYHGKGLNTLVSKPVDKLYHNIPLEFISARYHSWVVSDLNFPSEALEVTARDENGLIMSLSHRKYDIKGVQYHPESILTSVGRKIIANWLYA